MESLPDRKESPRFQSKEDRFEQVLAGRILSHPQAGKDDYRGAIRHVFHNLTQCPVQRDEDPLDGLLQFPSKALVESRMLLVYKMPTLMAHAVRLLEDDQKKIPVVTHQDVYRRVGFTVYTREKPVDKVGQDLSRETVRPAQVIWVLVRVVVPERVENVRGKLRWPAAGGAVTPVDSPVRKLYSSQPMNKRTLGHVEDGNPCTGVTQVTPKGIKLDIGLPK